MADGSELTKHYQYGFKALVFGSDTSYVTEKVEGLLGMPKANIGDTDKELDHGTFPGSILMRERTIDFDLKIVGQAGADIEQKLAVARKTFQVPRKRHSLQSEAFTFWRPGEPKKLIWTRCTRRDFTSEFQTARGLASGSVELHASDPLIYSAVENEETVTIADGNTLASTIVRQEGDYVDGSWPVLTITGPSENPIITNEQDDDRAIRLEVDIDAGDEIVIDVAREIVWLNGSRDYSIVRSDNQWWALLPGDNEITYSRTGTGISSELTITYRDVWQ